MSVPSLEEIAENLSKLLTNSVNIVSKYFDMFFNPNPMDVTLQQYDADGNLQTYTIPNRAKDKLTIDVSDKANIALDNLSSTGESHFANPSLSNLSTTGQNILSNKASINLDNLSATGEAKTVPSFTGMSGKFLTNNGVTTSRGTVDISGVPIGTIFAVTCTADYVPNGALACDGSEYTKAQFTSLWTNYLNASTPLLKTCSYSDYTTAITTYGQCPMFAIDTTNEKFKVPTIKDGSYLTQALSDSELGKSYNESLPNITGEIGASTRNGYEGGTSSGALGFKSTSQSVWYSNDGQMNISSGITFDASDSSSTYQNNASVQGNNVRVRYFVQVATGSINQSQMDWSAYASGLQAKVDKSTLVTLPAVLKTCYRNGTSGYNIWSNGYCEQWGIASSTTVTFLKTFIDTNYSLQMTYKVLSTSTRYGYDHPASISTTGFVIASSDFTSDGGYWCARGYLAEGAY